MKISFVVKLYDYLYLSKLKMLFGSQRQGKGDFYCRFGGCYEFQVFLEHFR